MPFVGYGVYRLVAGDAVADVAAPGARRRHRRLRRPQRRRARARRSSSACSRRCSTPPTARRCTRRSTSSQTIPAMALAHLTVAGVVEFALTVGVVAYLQRANLPLLRINHPDVARDRRRGRAAGRCSAGGGRSIGLGAMVVLDAARPARAGRRVRRGRARRPRPREVPPRAPSRPGLNGYTGFWSHTLLDGYGFPAAPHAGVGYVLSARRSAPSPSASRSPSRSPRSGCVAAAPRRSGRGHGAGVV